MHQGTKYNQNMKTTTLSSIFSETWSLSSVSYFRENLFYALKSRPQPVSFGTLICASLLASRFSVLQLLDPFSANKFFPSNVHPRLPSISSSYSHLPSVL